MGRDKALLPWAGTTLLDHALARLREACSSVRILSGAERRYDDRGVPVDTDAVPDAGPLGGIYTGLLGIGAGAGLFLGVDLPFVTVALLRRLLELSERHDAVVPESPRGPEPLCAVYRSTCLEPIRRTRGRQPKATTSGLRGRLQRASGPAGLGPLHEVFRTSTPGDYHARAQERWLTAVLVPVARAGASTEDRPRLPAPARAGLPVLRPVGGCAHPRRVTTPAPYGAAVAMPRPLAAAQELRGRQLDFPVEGFAREKLNDTFDEARTGHVHEAADIMAPRNTPVRAVEAGTVARLLTNPSGGITIYQLDPSERYVYYYAHLERYADGLREGSKVDRGQVLGYVGSSGNAPKSAPHLHFAIFRVVDPRQWWRGAPVNPYLVLR